MESQPPIRPAHSKTGRRNAVTLKLLFIAGLVLLLQVPLHLVNGLKQERRENRAHALHVAAEDVRTAPPDEVFENPSRIRPPPENPVSYQPVSYQRRRTEVGRPYFDRRRQATKGRRRAAAGGERDGARAMLG